MSTIINMPQVGQDILTAKIVEWYFRVGDTVKEGEILATVESDKASFEVEIPSDGILTRLLYKEGDEAEVLKPIAYLDENVASPGISASVTHDTEDAGKNGEWEDTPQTAELNSADGKIFVSPAARKKASEHGIKLTAVQGTGPSGRITIKDIEDFLESGHPLNQAITPAEATTEKTVTFDHTAQVTYGDSKIPGQENTWRQAEEQTSNLEPGPGDTPMPFSKTRKIIARRLTLSKQTIPHFYLFSDVCFSGVLQWKESRNTAKGKRISLNDIIIKAVAEALTTVREMNAWVDHEKVVHKKEVNLGIAVNSPLGILVPVIPDADTLTLDQISTISRKNAEDARRGIVTFTKPGTFTISNLGMFGVDSFLPVINPPECAILSVGALRKQAKPLPHGIRFTDDLTLGLACDHRAVDGSIAALFLGKIKEIIENYSDWQEDNHGSTDL